MTPEIKDFATWEEARLWLARHGWGLTQIEEQKVLWDEARAVKPVEKVVKPAAKTA